MAAGAADPGPRSTRLDGRRRHSTILSRGLVGRQAASMRRHGSGDRVDGPCNIDSERRGGPLATGQAARGFDRQRNAPGPRGRDVPTARRRRAASGSGRVVVSRPAQRARARRRGARPGRGSGGESPRSETRWTGCTMEIGSLAGKVPSRPSSSATSAVSRSMRTSATGIGGAAMAVSATFLPAGPGAVSPRRSGARCSGTPGARRARAATRGSPRRRRRPGRR